jgi:L-ascorbate metabolism protein UlaG (beta-lactamase superfamily)
MPSVRVVAATLLVTLLAAAPALAQGRFVCGEGLVEQKRPSLIHRAALEADRVPIRFIGHATFVIRSPQDVTVITDYNEYYRADVLPDIATMNANRGNHTTYRIAPSIAHALYGYDQGTGIPRHDVMFKDVRVYSEPTNISGRGGGYTNETAIFVIQVAGMCIAHLGHTAHMLDEETVRKLGTIDIAMTPVDRIVTQSYEEIFHNIKALRARVVIPMHDIGWTTEQFLAEAARRYPVKRGLGDTVEVSRSTLPQQTEVWMLQPRRGF